MIFFRWSLSTIFVVVTLLFSSTSISAPTDAKNQLDEALMKAAYEQILKESPKKPNPKETTKVATKKEVKTSSKSKKYKQLRVTATAYTSHVGQTDSTPNIAAWGDRLKPGMKAIAVSRDLLNVYGLKHKQKVRIKGLQGEYVVLDKMNKRWSKKIDIYMGMDKKKAFKWGRRKVEIYWNS